MTAEPASPLRLPEGPVAKFTPKKTSGPGTLKRQKETIVPTLSVEDLFGQTSLIFPGELVLYNAFSRATIKIETGEADSEVLLVTDDAVFYRVNDVLYRCPAERLLTILNNGTQDARILADYPSFGWAEP
jgi:hypothetical protein